MMNRFVNLKVYWIETDYYIGKGIKLALSAFGTAAI